MFYIFKMMIRSKRTVRSDKINKIKLSKTKDGISCVSFIPFSLTWYGATGEEAKKMYKYAWKTLYVENWVFKKPITNLVLKWHSHLLNILMEQHKVRHQCTAKGIVMDIYIYNFLLLLIYNLLTKIERKFIGSVAFPSTK